MHTPLPPNTFLVDTTEALTRLCEALSGLDRVGLDTEFHSERRYLPELMLLQLAAPDGRAWLVDPLGVDLKPLGPVLSQLTWITHGADMDLGILHRALGAHPKALWDTQIMAAFAGWDYPERLAALVPAVLDRPIDKGDGLSDWSTRPLRASQAHYAAEDARVVLLLERALRERIGDPDRLRWAGMAGTELAARAIRPPDPDAAWRRMEIVWKLTPDERRVISALHAWRHRRARAKDAPAHYTLSDGFALELARRQPRTLAALTANRRMPTGLVRRHGDHLVELIQGALSDPGEPPTAPSLDELRLASALQVWAVAIEPQANVNARLLMPRALALRIAARGVEAAGGWRGEAVGDALRRFLDGRAGVRVHQGSLTTDP